MTSRARPLKRARAWLAAIVLGAAAAGCGDHGSQNLVAPDANLAANAAIGDALGMNQAGEPAPLPPMTPGGFVNAVAASDTFAIESAGLAQSQAGSAEIKALAQRLRADHETSSIELQAAAGRATPPLAPRAALDAGQRDLLDQLKASNGADFDRRFIDQQTNAHQKALGLLQDYLGNGNSQPLKDFASKTRPLVQDHLEHLNRIRK